MDSVSCQTSFLFFRLKLYKSILLLLFKTRAVLKLQFQNTSTVLAMKFRASCQTTLVIARSYRFFSCVMRHIFF
jgi:hypothetical protein